jgi:hypothetical protein
MRDQGKEKDIEKDIESIPDVGEITTPLPGPDPIMAFLAGDLINDRAAQEELNEAAPMVVREARAADYNFVLKAWLVGARDHIWTHKVPDGFYFNAQRDAIAAVASRPHAVCLVAADVSDDNELFGFIVAERPHVARGPLGEAIRVPLIVHYVYTKRVFRKMDIARRLLQSVGWVQSQRLFGSHMSYVLTKDREALLLKYRYVFNPYALFDPTWYRNIDTARGDI